nr:hypothetical protein [Pseudomonas sp.]
MIIKPPLKQRANGLGPAVEYALNRAGFAPESGTATGGRTFAMQKFFAKVAGHIFS